MKSKIVISLLWGLTILASFPGMCLAERHAGIVVWKLQANKGVDETDVNLISNFVTNQVAKYSGNKVVSEADVQTILRGEETRQKCGVEDTSCMAEIGAALGVPEAVSGDIGKIGDYWMLNLRRINVRTAEVIGRSSRNIKGDVNILIESLPGIVAELFGKTVASAPLTKSESKSMASPVVEIGQLIVKTEPSGATLFIDGKEKGTTPFNRKMDMGEHKLEVKLEGYKTAKGSVEVDSQKATRLNLILERDYPMNPYKKYGYVMFFTGFGLAAFGGIATWQAKVAANDYKSGNWSAKDRNSGWTAGMGIGYGVGGALMVTGIVLWVLSPGDETWWKKHSASAGLAMDENGTMVTLGGRW